MYTSSPWLISVPLALSILGCGRSDLLDGEGDPFFERDAATIGDEPNREAGAIDGHDGGLVEAGIDLRAACLASDRSVLYLLEEQWNPIVADDEPMSMYWSHIIDALPGYIEVSSSNTAEWSLAFSTYGLGEPLKPGIYAATDSSFGVDGHAGMDIVRRGSANPYQTGQFEVVEMKVDQLDDASSVDIVSATIVFAIPVPSKISGCLHIARTQSR